MHDKYDIKFDPDGLFDYFGGVAGAADALVATKLATDRLKILKRMQKQKERGYVTSEIVAVLMVAAARLGARLDLYDFLIEREK